MSKRLLGMKALSVHQPYAGLIELGLKTIETRSWATKYRGPLLICSSQKWHPKAKWAKSVVEDSHDSIVWFEECIWNLFGCHSDQIPGAAHKRTPDGENGYLSFWNRPWMQGQALGIVDLVDCLPIYDHSDLEDDGLVPSSSDYLFVHEHDPHGRHLSIHQKAVGVPQFITEFDRGEFRSGNFGWLLANYRPICAREVKGQQGLWTVKESNLR